MNFLKMQDKSLAFLQKKIDQIMGRLAKMWQARLLMGHGKVKRRMLNL
jgi:hypothetical protein